MLSLTILHLTEVIILAVLSHIDFRVDIVQHRLSRLKRLICQVIVPIGNIELFQSCFLIHPMMSILPVLLLHGPSPLNIVALLLRQLVRQIHSLLVFDHHRVTELVTPLLPILQSEQSLIFLVLDLLLFHFLRMLKPFLQFQFFLSCLLLLLLA